MKTISEFCESFWAWRMRNFPLYASFCGNHEYGDVLDALLPEEIMQKQEYCQNMFRKLVPAMTVPGLTKEEKVNAKLLLEELKTFNRGVNVKGYLFPVNFMEGIQVDFHLVLDWSVFNCEKDFENYIARLGQLAIRAKDTVSLLDQGIQLGMVCSGHSMKRVDDQLAEYEKKAIDSFLYKPFLNLPSSIPEARRTELCGQAVNVIDNQLKNAMKELRVFIAERYMPQCRQIEGVHSLPNGLEYYNVCLRFHVSTKITPDEVHQIGLREVSRIQGEMNKVKESLGFDGTLKEFINSLKDDPQQYFKTREEAMDYLRKLTDKIREKLPLVIKNIPKTRMVLAEVPEQQKSNPIGYYYAGNADGSRPGTYYVNTNDLSMLHKMELVALSLHEGEPGHHLQAMHSAEQKGLPEFRKQIQDYGYSLCPAHFPLNTALIEGWGLYSEGLGKEMDLYDDPYDWMGRLSFEIHRAMRLVVDTGIHVFGWSREKAIEYMCDNSALSQGFVVNEVDRYITWPGQACAYKLGELKLLELRDRAKDKLGSAFDLRDFHEVVLDVGAAPLSVVEELVDQYIEETLKK